MNEFAQPAVQFGDMTAVLEGVLVFAAYLALGLIPIGAVLYLVYFLLTLPLRRNERARLFLDMLELGLRNGQSGEATIASAAASRERSFGVRFYVLAEHVSQGRQLSEALALVPRLVPPRVAAMLATGERLGDIGKVLPACRRALNDGVSQVRGALNYVLLLVFAATPALVAVPLVFGTYVLPKYQEIFGAMLGGPFPAFTRLVFNSQGWFLLLQVGALLFLWLALLAYLGGPRLTGWLNRIAPGLVDRISLMLPWRWKRVQRDFSALLALLLDAQVPEPDAVKLAAQGTGNAVFSRRAGAVVEALRGGLKLPDALARLDDDGELRWRVANAAHGGKGFVRALEGWHEALEAKAFQLEQAAAQSATTAVVLLNGFIVGCIVLAVFLPLIDLINQATLW